MCPTSSSDKKRLLITGINGFTGRYVRDEFLKSGWEVYGCGASPTAELPNYCQADLLDPKSLEDVVVRVQPHAVVHLAGIAFAAHRHPIDFYAIHVQGTLNLLSTLDKHGVGLEKVLLASTANVYGNSVAGIFVESSPLKPFNDYGVSKLAMEYMAWLWREKLPIIIVRPFNYTGVGQAPQFLLPKIVDHFRRRERVIELGNLDVRRDFSDVRNVASAYRRLVEHPEAKGAVNVCSGVPYSVKDVLAMATQIAGYEIEVNVNPAFLRPGEVDLLCGSHARLEEMVGVIDWIPLQETIQWMMSIE